MLKENVCVNTCKKVPGSSECLQEAATGHTDPAAFPRISTKRGDLASGPPPPRGPARSLSLCRPQPEYNPSLMLLLGLKEKQQFSIYRNLSREDVWIMCCLFINLFQKYCRYEGMNPTHENLLTTLPRGKMFLKNIVGARNPYSNSIAPKN